VKISCVLNIWLSPAAIRSHQFYFDWVHGSAVQRQDELVDGPDVLGPEERVFRELSVKFVHPEAHDSGRKDSNQVSESDLKKIDEIFINQVEL
jgi:hypothetical protein